MPPHVILFYVLLIATAIAAATWGAAPERIGGAMLIAATFLTAVVRQDDHYRAVQAAVASIDVLLLVGLIWLSLHAKRQWPLWSSSFQLVTTTAHLVKIINPGVLNTAYALLLILSAYPTVILLAGGVWHHRRRMSGSGYDPSWTRRPRSRPTGVGGGR